jgi:hypothetical protein
LAARATPSRPKSTPVATAKGRPVGFVLTPGQNHNDRGFLPLLRMIGERIRAPVAGLTRRRESVGAGQGQGLLPNITANL